MSASPVRRSAAAVTVLVTRRARAGREADFVRANEGMMAEARGFSGHLGGYLVHPSHPEGADARLFHVLFAFDTPENLRAWQDSPERASWLSAMAPHTESESGHRLIPGLEYWFALPGRSPPPRWKVAIVTWLGICPTAWLALDQVAPLLAHWPSLPRVALVTALIVSAMTWGIAPLLTRLFAGWLHPSAAATPRV